MENYNLLNFEPELIRLYKLETAIGRAGIEVPATGLSTVNNLLIIRKLIFIKKPIKTLEIGLGYGGSAAAIVRSLSDCHGGTDFEHSAIDPCQVAFHHAGPELLARAGFEKNFQYYDGPSDLVLPKLAGEGKKYDLIYIDGYHIFESIFIDMYYSIKILNKGGILFFDDCADKHVKKVIRFVSTNLTGYMQAFSLEKFQPSKSLIKKIANKLGYRQMCAFEKTADLPRAWDAPFVKF